MLLTTGTLDEFHPLGSLLPLPTIVSYLAYTVSELKETHRLDIAHGALQPTHLMLDSYGHIVITGFGDLAHPLYRAPEQWSGKTLPASDQYALGILVYQWLCGRVPFQGNDLQEQHLRSAPPSLRKQLPTIPSGVEQVVLRALAKDPDDRYPSLEAFVGALTHAVSASMSTVPKEEPEEPEAGGQVLVSPVQSTPTWQQLFTLKGASHWRADRWMVVAGCVLISILLLVLFVEVISIVSVHFHDRSTTQFYLSPTNTVPAAKKPAPMPTPTLTLHTVPFTLSTTVSGNTSSLSGMTLDTYTASNLGHDLGQQESDGMLLTFTNISSPCQDVTFPVGQIADSIGNAFFLSEAIALPCSVPTTTVKVATEQYSQTGTFPPNALYSITEQLSILPEDPASVLSRLLGQEEQNAAAQFSSDISDRYPSAQFPIEQFQEQNMLCVHTNPEVENNYVSIAEVACATFVLDPWQLPFSVTKVEQADNAAIRSCTVDTATLDTHTSFLTFDGAGNPIVSLRAMLKGRCMAEV